MNVIPSVSPHGLDMAGEKQKTQGPPQGFGLNSCKLELPFTEVCLFFFLRRGGCQGSVLDMLNLRCLNTYKYSYRVRVNLELRRVVWTAYGNLGVCSIKDGI